MPTRKRTPSGPTPPEPDSREETRQGPPLREATVHRSDHERRELEHVERDTAAGPALHERRELEHVERDTAADPALSGGDVDADWERGATVGEEAVGGTVATPDQDVVDELGAAWGVDRPDDAEVETSGEILERRDRARWEQEEGGEGWPHERSP